MFRLIGKILLAYWFAAGLAYLVSCFGMDRQGHHTELSDALNRSITLNGAFIAGQYERGDCSQTNTVALVAPQSLVLFTPQGTLLCGATEEPEMSRLARTSARAGRRATLHRAAYELVAAPVSSANGTSYVVVLKAQYSSRLEAFGLLPGPRTIATSFAVSGLLAILIAFPIRKLSTAAGEIAMGKLETRVQWGAVLEPVFGRKGRDDISRLVRDFNDMAERLEALTVAQRILLRDLSHELRSPLNRLGIGLSLARREPFEEPMRLHLDRIGTEAKRLNELIGQILSLSYLESIQEKRPAIKVPLTDLFRKLLPAIRYEADQCGCLITTHIQDDCLVVGDEGLLRSALENILRNALRFVPSSGVIQVEVARVSAGHELQSLIRIADNGPGIPEDEIASVFEPFFRSKSSSLWGQGGFGIGLTIAQRAVRVHGGSIYLHNRLEGGLMVEMRFPAAAGGSFAEGGSELAKHGSRQL